MQFFLKLSITCRVRTHRNIFFLFSLFLGLPQRILARKVAIIVFSNFLNFFTFFFAIFHYGSCRNSSERFILFYFIIFFFLFLGLSQLILAWREAIMVFFKFLNFFAIFMEFPITGLVGTRWNEFSFPFFSAFPNLFWLEKKR